MVERLDPKPLTSGGSCGSALRSTRSTFQRVGRLALGLALTSTMWAQGANMPSVHFTVFAPKPITDLTFVPRAGAPPQKVQFQPTARSIRYEYRGLMPLRFVDELSGGTVAEVNVPANLRDVLLLFAPLEGADANAAKGGLKYQVAVLDDSALREAPGGLAIINLSGLALAGTVNKEKVTLKPGLNPAINIGRTANVTLTTTFKNKTYQSYTGTVTLGRNERALLILFPPFYKGALEVQSRLLVDLPPGMAPPPKVVPKKKTEAPR